MTLQELRYFCVTAEVLHYTRAARLLYISQPSLSYAISKLEQELGLPLFEKNGKKVTLTKYGEEFLPYAKRALAEISEGTERLREMKIPSTGGISLGYIYSVSFSALPEFVNSFYKHQGGDRIAFRFRTQLPGLVSDTEACCPLRFYLQSTHPRQRPPAKARSSDILSGFYK